MLVSGAIPNEHIASRVDWMFLFGYTCGSPVYECKIETGYEEQHFVMQSFA